MTSEDKQNGRLGPTSAPREFYQGLPVLSAGSIRVMDLLPARLHDEVRVILRVRSISKTNGSSPVSRWVPKDHQSGYEALSYTWGQREHAKSIRVNAIYDVKVTDNLHNALRRLRRRFKVRTVWVDAICIDQQNEREKSRQVAMMDIIFRWADCVNVWLGEYDPELPRVVLFTLLHPIYRLRELRRKGNTRFVMPTTVSALRDLWATSRHIEDYLESAIVRTYPKWYTRAWTVQEFVVARKIMICFGSQHFRYDRDQDHSLFLSMCKIRDEKGGKARYPNVLDFVSRVGSGLAMLKYEMDARVFSSSEEGYAPFLQCLLRVSGNSATNPRDLVFSMLGLLEEGERNSIGCDYTMPVAEVYARATYASLCHSGLEILQHVQLSSDKELRTQGLPSWLVDFAMCKPKDMSTSSRLGHWSKSLQIRDSWANSCGFVLGIGLRLTLVGARCDQIVGTLALCGSKLDEQCLVSSAVIDTFVLDANTCFATSALGSGENGSTDRLAHGLLYALQRDGRLAYTAMSKPTEDCSWSTEACISRALNDWRFAIKERTEGLIWDTEDAEFRNSSKYLWTTFSHYSLDAARGLVLFRTSKGLLGLAPKGVMPGDEMLLACHNSIHSLLILRPGLDGYRFHGIAFVLPSMIMALAHQREEGGHEHRITLR